MTITLTPPAGAAVTLCAGPTRTAGSPCGPDGYALRRVPGLLRREYVEDTGIRIEHIGNDEVSGSFSVTYVCASRAAAATALSGVIKDTPAAGTLTDGTVTVYNAGLTDISGRQSGRSFRVTYSFTGSLTQEPAS